MAWKKLASTLESSAKIYGYFVYKILLNKTFKYLIEFIIVIFIKTKQIQSRFSAQ